MPTSKQIEQLQLAARLALSICLDPKSEGTADTCNLSEIAYAGLGYEETHPQVSLDVIETYVKNQLGTRYLPVEREG